MCVSDFSNYLIVDRIGVGDSPHLIGGTGTMHTQPISAVFDCLWRNSGMCWSRTCSGRCLSNWRLDEDGSDREDIAGGGGGVRSELEPPFRPRPPGVASSSGTAHRAFLHGLGDGMDCSYSRPRPTHHERAPTEDGHLSVRNVRATKISRRQFD